MKCLPFAVSLPILLLTACTRELPGSTGNAYLRQVKTGLQRVVPRETLQSLDFRRARKTPDDSSGNVFLRLPFQGRKLSEGFVLLQTTREGHLLKGRQIQLIKDRSSHPTGYYGAITIRALDGTILTGSPIVNGYITAFHEQPTALKTASLMPEGETLPEVVVVASYSYNGGISYSDWLYVQSIWGSDSGSSGYYYYLDGSGAYSGGGTGGSGEDSDSVDDGVMSDPPLVVDYETQDILDPIDVRQYINCFNRIPDEGATCSIELFADIPVDSDPNMFFDFTNGSPGHTFLQLKKSNGTVSVVQNIGFYPKSGLKAVLTNAPIEGKLVDNGEHEFNVSIKMNLNPTNFNSTLMEILYLSNFIKYDIDNYNCTDFALDVFNKTRTNKFEIDLYDIPGNYPSIGTRTPQGVFNKLKEMKDSNHPEAANITFGIVKGWVAASSGPCN